MRSPGVGLSNRCPVRKHFSITCFRQCRTASPGLSSARSDHCGSWCGKAAHAACPGGASRSRTISSYWVASRARAWARKSVSSLIVCSNAASRSLSLEFSVLKRALWDSRGSGKFVGLLQGLETVLELDEEVSVGPGAVERVAVDCSLAGRRSRTRCRRAPSLRSRGHWRRRWRSRPSR